MTQCPPSEDPSLQIALASHTRSQNRFEGPAQAGSDWETFFMAKAKIVRKAAVKKVAKAAPRPSSR